MGVLGGVLIVAALLAGQGLFFLTSGLLSSVIPWVGLYHALLFTAFFLLYAYAGGGFAKNFTMPKGMEGGTEDALYFTAVAHSTTGFGDVWPKTSLARRLVMLHVLLVFVVTAGAIQLGWMLYRRQAA